MATKQILNCLPEEYINELLNLQEVKSAKEQIDAKTEGSVYFSINVTLVIKEFLQTHFGLDFSAVSQIPMRWMKGDTRPHADNGIRRFQKTHLVYLTDSPGELVVDGASYPINKGCAYSFAEGLRHETVNTGSEPRLLLGPMSEEGFAVGGATIIQANGQTDIVYFKYFDGTGILYKINDGDYNGFLLPVTIQNTNIDTQYPLKVLFENNLILDSPIWYFICGSDNIQFGSTSLNSDGSRPVITIDSVTNYLGLIQNGNEHENGFDNIYVYNLKVNVTNGSTLSVQDGWIGQQFFGKSSVNNYIINCSSTGDISTSSGGILGANSGKGAISLYVIGCSSEGNIGNEGGGIVGSYTAEISGNIIIKYCYSIGNINQFAGGICGAVTNNANVINCYSEGNQISTKSGGIFGYNAGYSGGNAVAYNCYSLGNIGINGGGIFGANAGSLGGTTSAINCYSSGNIATSGNGIYGSNKQSGTETSCYAANGSWSDISAISNLTGAPNPIIGDTWIASAGINQPYELNNMGYTPYSLTIIDASSNLIQTYSQTISAGSSTIQAIVPNKNYQILAIQQEGNFISVPSITINSTTGAISTTPETTPGTYTITLRNTGSYNITQFELTVNEAPKPQQEEVAEQEACICSQKPCAQLSYVGITQSDKITNIIDNRAIATSYNKNNIEYNVRGRQFPSFADYLRYQQAQLKYY